MSYNGSGVYTLPGAQLANGATVSATENNQFRNDVAAALNVAWTRDGQAPASSDIPMGSNKLTELAQPTTEGDALAFGKNAEVADLSVTGASDVTGNQTVGGDSDVTGDETVGGNLTVTGTASFNGEYFTPYTGFKNRIINGDMRINQRSTGSQVPLAAGVFLVDRWTFNSNKSTTFNAVQTTGGPAGFTKFLTYTSTGANTPASGDFQCVSQYIEGFNVADLAWGTANAKAITVSAWVQSSVTGTFGGSVANTTPNRSYPFTYSIPVANTWTYITVTIPGDTSGTWATDNSAGLRLNFSLGCGSITSGTAGTWASANYNSATGAVAVSSTNGATFGITGVQLEKGSVATPFEVRPYGTELQLCQRYYFKTGFLVKTSGLQPGGTFPVPMRVQPSASVVSISAGSGATVSTMAFGLSQTYYQSNANSADAQCNFETSGAEL